MANYGNLQSMNDVFRDTKWLDMSTSFSSEFLDLTSVHSIYLHCTNLGHFISVGVRGQSDIIKKINGSSSFGLFILDLIVAPHDKVNVSGQWIKNTPM